MRLVRSIALALAATLAIAAGPAKRANWNAVVTVTPLGSHVLGNPAARLKLTEFVSYTCPHCAHFERDASDRLRLGYVSQGTLSVEIRNLVRDPIDMTAAMLTNCGPPAKFPLNHTAFLRSQDRWISAGQNASEAQQKRWSSGAMPNRMRNIANDFGFYAIMQTRGYDRVAVDRCLGDQAMARRLAEQTKSAETAGVNNTPSFLLNGELLAGTHDWESLQVQLRARM